MRPLALGSLQIAPPLLLAPMEGVTDPCFRGLLIETSGADALGAACTEFLRVTDHPLAIERVRAELAPHRGGRTAIGVQLMGNRLDAVAASAAIAAAAGAAFVDLNFGCPAPRVFSHCAGSALLAEPARLEALVRAAVAAVAGAAPVTAKIRAGIANDRGLEEIARRVEDAGAAALTVHARLRVDSYEQPARWERIARAKAAVRIPVIGNGSADDAAAAFAMFARTGCDAVMIGRGALADPWIFRAIRAAQRGEAFASPDTAARLRWIELYAARMQERAATPAQALGRAKQALKAAVAGGRLPVASLTAALRARTLTEFADCAADRAA
jgi:nifR3 family TIM-barrel protein